MKNTLSRMILRTKKKNFSLKQSLSGYESWLSERVDGATLSLFRILFGLFLLADTVHFFLLRQIYFPEQVIQFTYSGFEGWPRLSPVGVDLALLGMGIFAVMITLGLFYRIACAGFIAILAQFMLEDASFYLNHLVLVLVVNWVLIWVPADRTWSVQTKKLGELAKKLTGNVTKQSSVSPLAEPITRLDLAVVIAPFMMAYFLGGVQKLRWEWFSGDILLVNFVSGVHAGNFLAKWISHLQIYPLLAVVVLLVELGVPFLLLFRKFRFLAVVILVAFHLVNHLCFSIGLFSYLMISAMVLYFDPSWPMLLLDKLKKLLSRSTEVETKEVS